MKAKAMLFLTAWLQVTLISCNTWQIANSKWIGALIVGFAISFVWCFNISRVAFSDILDKLIYATGACAGTGTGLIIASSIY